MRSMLAASKDQQAAQSLPETSSKSKGPKLKELDPITVSMLRAAGVSGYQGDEQAEAELTIKLVNADYVAKQVCWFNLNVGLNIYIYIYIYLQN